MAILESFPIKNLVLLMSMLAAAAACTEIVVQPLQSDDPVVVDGGDGTEGSRSVADAAIRAPLSVQSVSAGVAHTCAVMSDGSVQCWGDNSAGELGDGTFAQRLTPIRVEGVSGVRAVSGGYLFACALLNDGTVKCWGDNSYGQLGDGSITRRASPVTVSGLTDVVSISTGLRHACATLSDGTGKCWGANRVGQLGDGTTNDRRLPVQVSSLSGIRRLSAAWDYSCAVLEDGSVRCWGVHEPSRDVFYNNASLPSDRFDALPTLVAEFDHVDSLATGSSALCALGGGKVSCKAISPLYWFRYPPVPENEPNDIVFVPEAFNGANAISAEGDHVCALLSGGKVSCWGGNRRGQLGDGTTDTRNARVDVTNVEGVVQISSGGVHSCAVRTTGQVNCWGENYAGELGNGDAVIRTTPTLVSDLAGVKQVALSGWNTFPEADLVAYALKTDGSVYCWGDDTNGACGQGIPSGKITRPKLIPSLAGVTSMSAAYGRACVTKTDHSVWCWGGYEFAPTRDVGMPDSIGVVVLSSVASCTLTTTGAVRCRSGSSRAVPEVVPDLAGVTAIAGEGDDMCALLGDGTIRCFSVNDRTLYEPRTGAGPWVEIGVDHGEMCALSSYGTVVCTPLRALDPAADAPLSPLSARHIFMGGGRACATLANETSYCWRGGTFPNMLPEDYAAQRTFAVREPGLDGLVSYAFAAGLSCGLDAAGAVSCWGYNGSGMISGSIPQSTPNQVTILK